MRQGQGLCSAQKSTIWVVEAWKMSFTQDMVGTPRGKRPFASPRRGLLQCNIKMNREHGTGNSRHHKKTRDSRVDDKPSAFQATLRPVELQTSG